MTESNREGGKDILRESEQEIERDWKKDVCWLVHTFRSIWRCSFGAGNF